LRFNGSARITVVYSKMGCRLDVVVAYYEILFKYYLGMTDVNHEKYRERTVCALEKVQSPYS
jgi:hypothetical protein